MHNLSTILALTPQILLWCAHSSSAYTFFTIMRALRTTNTSMLHTDDCNCKCEHVLHTPYNTLHWLEIQCYEYTYSRWLPAKVTIIPLNNAFVLHWCFYECARWCPVRRMSMMIFASHIIWVYRSGLELSTDKLQNLGYSPKCGLFPKI